LQAASEYSAFPAEFTLFYRVFPEIFDRRNPRRHSPKRLSSICCFPPRTA
jgi:hypothetical protein